MPRSFYYHSSKYYYNEPYDYRSSHRKKPHPKCPTGSSGPTGSQFSTGPTGERGPSGPTGERGPSGPTGEQGPQGKISNGADFYALMPNDNTATIAPGSNIEFPNDGPNVGSTISRTGPSTFNLTNIGMYLIQFQVSIAEAGQLCIKLNSIEQQNSVVGRATGTSQIVGINLITTASANSILSISNPIAEPTALTLTPLAGGSNPVSAHLVILQIM